MELEISCANAEARQAAEDFARRLAMIEDKVEEILPAAEAHPGTPLLQLYAAFFYLFGQTTAAQAEAGKYLDKAAALEGAMNPREQSLMHVARLWMAENYHAAIPALETHTLQWPRDVAAAKMLEFLYYVLGQQHNGDRFRRHFGHLHDANRDHPGFLAMYAFAHELSDRQDDAQAIAEKALALEPRNPWAHHCLSHVYIRRGNREAALDTMRAYLPVWQEGNRVIYCHNAWHLALVHLDLLDLDGAMGVFRDHVWGVMPDTPGEEVDAIALLWRLELAGRPVEDAVWNEVADYVEARTGESFMPFLAAHFAYALARAGREEATAQLLATIGARAQADDAYARRVWAPVGRDVVEASAAFARGDFARTAALLEPLMFWDITAIGGSDAQDDLWRQTYFHALVRAGRAGDARQYFDEMTRGKVLSRLEMDWARLIR